ncbi:ribonuclease Z [Weissella viridescens]|nr:ribonuclease Z [Weissella viridescens]MBX4172179.1 ribonuclease Z [Weissella viridescens]MCB6839802.1 ribonuclease Z [Weissella viridescens]MCB6846534.1 ribonuclease Z [Weissella viridescens]QOD85637.1 ribonuclease Z [Weissella viridescens]WJI90750.1 ribonuclease Z [Weissella viridescens]
MQLEFLGTGASVPARFRNVTSIALRLLDELNSVWLFDVGEGTQIQMLSSSIRPRKIDKIFITHLHGDHIFGLPGLLASRSFQGGDDTMTIYGPKGIKRFVETSLQVSQTHLTYPLAFVEIDPVGGVVFEDDKMTVTAKPLDHKILSFGYRIDEHDMVGELQVDKLKALNVPAGPQYGQLKNGNDITLADGTLIKSADVIGPAKKGRSVVILGDTRKTDEAAELAEGADVLVHESTYGKGEGKKARNHYHATSLQAAEIAEKAHVGRLFLTHISARYAGKSASALAYQARTIFENTRVVNDFDVFEIPYGEQTNSKPIKIDHVIEDQEG